MGCLKKLPQFRLSNLFSKSPMQAHTCLFLRALLLALPTKNNYQIILLHPHPTQNTPSFPSLLSFSPSSFPFFIHSFLFSFSLSSHLPSRSSLLCTIFFLCLLTQQNHNFVMQFVQWNHDSIFFFKQPNEITISFCCNFIAQCTMKSYICCTFF